jgi:excinuclease UvrABC helicase subunit UvrB
LPKGEAEQPKPSLKDYIVQSKQNAKIQAQIEKLEKKLANEKQFNRQVEIRAEIKKLEKEMGKC